jgi:hypothetical protein
MSSELISLSQLAAVTKQAGGIIASAWSEAAKLYQKKWQMQRRQNCSLKPRSRKSWRESIGAKMEQAEALKDTVLF